MIRLSRGSCFAVALAATVTLGGCTVHQRLATQAVSFNLAVEKAQNEMLLLNVIRAKDHLPMYLMEMSTLSGNVQTTIGASTSGAYTRVKGSTASVASTPGSTGVDSTANPTGTTMGTMASDMLTRTYMPSAMASEMENPTYTMSLLDTQEFMRGFMSNLSKQTFTYYWNEGWPRELLEYLLVERIEVTDKCTGVPTIYRNDPERSDDFKAFGQEIAFFLSKNPTIRLVPSPDDIGPPIPASDLNDLDKLVKMAREDSLALTPDKDKGFYQLQRSGQDVCFAFDGGPKCTSSSKSDKNGDIVAETDKLSVSLSLRSPDALLNYLGDLVRLENRKKKPYIPRVCVQGHFEPIFVALPAGRCANALLSVESSQGAYSVPRPDPDEEDSCTCKDGELQVEATGQCQKWPVCDGGNSMLALRLLTQVMALQKSAKDLPSPSLVRVIGN